MAEAVDVCTVVVGAQTRPIWCWWMAGIRGVSSVGTGRRVWGLQSRLLPLL